MITVNGIVRVPQMAYCTTHVCVHTGKAVSGFTQQQLQDSRLSQLILASARSSNVRVNRLSPDCQQALNGPVIGKTKPIHLENFSFEEATDKPTVPHTA